MDFNSVYGEKLFNLLPEIYKHEDSLITPSPYPLRRYMNIIGSGLDELSKGMDEYKDLKNIDKCPDHLLDIACNFYDFKFPANTPPETKRKMLKVFPKLYQSKGTRQAYQYLVRAMFGVTSEIDVYTQRYEEGMAMQELRKIFLKVQVDDTVLDLNNKMNNFETYVEIIRPVNRRFVITLSTLFNEDFQSGRLTEEELIMKLYTNYFQDDRFRGLNEPRDILFKSGGFIYTLKDRNPPVSDVMKIGLVDEVIDMRRYLTKTSKLNQDKLNTSFMLSTSHILLDRLKDSTVYDVPLNVTEEHLAHLYYVDGLYNSYNLNKSRLNKHTFTGTSAYINTKITEGEEDFKPKTMASDLHTLKRAPESYAKINKSILNSGIVLTHKKHCDIIRINGAIQKIV